MERLGKDIHSFYQGSSEGWTRIAAVQAGSSYAVALAVEVETQALFWGACTRDIFSDW